MKTCEDDSTKPTVGKSHIFVPQKIGSISSYASSNLPKLRKAHYSNSKRRQPLAAVNLDSRTQVVGFSGSSNSAGAGVNPTRDEVLEASNKLEPVQKLGMKVRIRGRGRSRVSYWGKGLGEGSIAKPLLLHIYSQSASSTTICQRE